MKSKELQNVVLSKYQNSDATAKIYHNLSDAIRLRTIKQWCQMIRQTGTIGLPGCPRWVRTKANIKKVNRLRRKLGVSARKVIYGARYLSGEY